MSVALGLIHQQPEKFWTVKLLAKQANLSRSAFAARFKTLVGETPLQYFSRWRMYQAVRLLLSTNKPLREIAEALGYE